MDPKDRAELDRLLDLAEKEQLLAPQAPQPTNAVLDEMREQALAQLEHDAEAIRLRRRQIEVDAEWLEE